MKKTAFAKLWNSVRLGIPLAALIVAAASSPAAENTGHLGIVGTWVTTATIAQPVPPGFPPDGKFEAVETFFSDGTMNVVSNLPGVTIGAGVWKQTGPGRFTFTFSFYRLDTSVAPPDSPFNHLMLGANVMENVLLYNGGDSYITTDMIVPLDGNLTTGAPLHFFPGTVKGVRYQFGNFNTALPQLP
jgi:hypothetical protein